MPAFPNDVIAGSTHNMILNTSRDTVHGLDVLPGLMISMLEDDIWRRMVRPVDGQVFTHDTIEQWVLGPPWAGLKFPSWDALYAILSRSEKGRRAMSMLRERGAPVHAVLADTPAAKPDGKRGKHGDAPSFRADQHSSTSAARIAARLKRDHPEIAEAAARGEYPSMRAAGIAAGIVRVPTSVDVLWKTWCKASEVERAQFLTLIEARQ